MRPPPAPPSPRLSHCPTAARVARAESHTNFRDADVALAWVETADGLRHVGDYAHLPPPKRPAATCPVCGREVTLKLGQRRAHHAAHAQDDRCVVTQPETALHFNLKCHLAAELERAAADGRPLRIIESCMVGRVALDASGDAVSEPGDEEDPDDPEERDELRELDGAPDPYDALDGERWASPCPERRERVWIERWDRVVLERRIGDKRTARIPDVVLYLSDVVVGAVEVFHSHAVDRTKATALAALGVPWAEVRADAALLTPGSAWTANAPLPAHRVGPSARWRCPGHAAAEAERREAARHTTRVCAAKVVDLLYPSGKVFRNVYRVVEHLTDGRPRRVTVEVDDRLLLEEPFDEAYEPRRKRALWDRIQERVARDVRGAETKRGARTDSAMDWARGRLAARIAREAEGGWWERVPLERTHPLRWRFARGSGQWFQPRDLRDADWTRPDDDPLREPHPASHRPHPSAARSRPTGTGPKPVQRADAPAADDPPLAAHPTSVPPPSFAALAASLLDDSPPVAARTIRPAPAEPTSWTPADPIGPTDIGPIVRATFAHAAAIVCELQTLPGARRAAVVALPTLGAKPEAIRALDRQLAAGDVDRLWVGRRDEWTHALVDVPWLEARCAADGALFVVVSGHRLTLPCASEWLVEGVVGLDAPRVLAARQAAALPAEPPV